MTPFRIGLSFLGVAFVMFVVVVVWMVVNVRTALKANASYASSPQMHAMLADRYETAGHYDQAILEYQKAIQLNPNFEGAYNNLAWLLATCPDARYRDGKTAVVDGARACDLSEDRQSDALDTLAASYAETGDFNSAITWENRALSVGTLDAADSDGAHRRLALYQQHQPYHRQF
jgi:tetratricopeptide (TPR) repeat protein